MTLTLKFETMSSNFVCNEAFSEGNQTGSSVTPELPIFCRELEADDEKRSVELNSRLTEMRNSENSSSEQNSKESNNKLNSVSQDNTRIVDSPCSGTRQNASTNFNNSQNSQNSQNQQNYQNSPNQVQSDEVTAQNPSFSQIDDQQQQQFHQNSTFLQNPERQRTNTGNSTLSKNSTQSNSSTITGRLDISQPLLNPNNGIINDPRYSLTVSLTGDLENQTDDRARLFDNQEMTTPTTSPSRMNGQIRDYNYQQNITNANQFQTVTESNNNNQNSQNQQSNHNPANNTSLSQEATTSKSHFQFETPFLQTISQAFLEGVPKVLGSLSYTQLGTGHNGVDPGLTGNFSQFNNMEVSAESTNLFSTLESADNYPRNSANSTNQQQQRKDWNPEALTSVFENGTLQKRPHRRAQEAPHIRQLDYLFHGRNTIMLSSHGVDPSVILDPAYPFVNPSDPETTQNNQTTSFSTNKQLIPHHGNQRHNSKKQASFRKEYCIQNIIPTSEIQKPKTPIGHGGFGQVYRAIRKQQIPSHNKNQLSFDTVERHVAIKEHNSLSNLKDRSLDERMKILRDIVEEGRVHRDYKHEYIIGLEGFWLDDEAFTRDYEDWTNSKNESDRTQKYHCESPFAYPKLSIVLEYAAGGSLFYYLKQKNSVTDNISRLDINQENNSPPCQQHKLSPDDLINWTKQVVGATKFLHDKYLIHCDIKSHNVLLSLNTESLLEQYGHDQGSMIKAQLFNQEIEPTELEPNLFTLKLTDFGTAKIIERDGKTKTINKPQSGDRYYNSVRTVEHKLMGTGAWMAPELFKAISSQENSKASDIWALGVLLWEILTGRQPYQGIEHIAIGMWVCHEGQKLIIPGYAPAIFQEILRKCWGKEPKDRISAQEIIEKIDEFNISEYDSYRTINVLDYQEQLQQASDLLLERSQSLDLEQDKIKWRADILTVREEQFETEKINFKKLQENLVLEQRKTHAKEDLIRLLTTSEHYTKQQIVTDKMKKFRKVLAKRIRKNKIKIEVDHSKFTHLPGTEDFAKFQTDSDYKSTDRLGNLKNVPNSGPYGNSGTYGTPSSFSMDRSGNEDIMSSKSSSSNYHYRTKPNSPKVAGVPGNMMTSNMTGNTCNMNSYDNRLNPLQVPTASIPPYTSNSSGYHQNNSSINGGGSLPRHAANSTSSNVQVTQSSETIQSPSSTNGGTSNSMQNSKNTYATHNLPTKPSPCGSFSTNSNSMKFPAQSHSPSSNYCSPQHLPPPVPPSTTSCATSSSRPSTIVSTNQDHKPKDNQPKNTQLLPQMISPHMPSNQRNPPPVPKRPDDDKLQNFTRKNSGVGQKITNNPAYLAVGDGGSKKYDPQVYRPRIHGKDGGFTRGGDEIDLKNVAEQLLKSENQNTNSNNNKTRSLERGVNGLSRSDSVSSLDNLPDATQVKQPRASTVHRMNTAKLKGNGK